MKMGVALIRILHKVLWIMLKVVVMQSLKNLQHSVKKCLPMLLSILLIAVITSLTSDNCDIGKYWQSERGYVVAYDEFSDENGRCLNKDFAQSVVDNVKSGGNAVVEKFATQRKKVSPKQY
jgi:hypothetical protein